MKLSRDKIQRMIDVGSGGSSGGVSGSELAGMLAGYATEGWVNDHYISIDFFSRLFQAHGTENGQQTDIDPNDMDSTITSVESMFGFWTNLYLSAMGNNSGGSAGLSLDNLTDVNISGTPTSGQVLTFDAVSGKWVNGSGGVTSLAGLTDVTITTPANGQTLLYDSTTSKWYNSALKTINGQSLLGSGDISVGGGASGNYLPLSGGNLTGSLGILSPSPQGRLDVSGITFLRGALYLSNVDNGPYTEGIRISNSTASGTYCSVVFGANPSATSGTHADQWQIGRDNENHFFWNIGGSVIARMLKNGNFGLGTSSPSQRLEVVGRSNLKGTVLVSNVDTEADNEGIRLANTKDNSWSTINFGCDPTQISGSHANQWGIGRNYQNVFLIRCNGRTNVRIEKDGDFKIEGGVYINATKGGYREGIRLANSAASGTYSTVVFGADPSADSGTHSTQWQIGRDNYNKFFWNIGGSVIAAIGTNGYWGLGTESPSYRLHVDGTIYATGAITALSDMRDKTVVENITEMNLEKIANAPVFTYHWKDKIERRCDLHIGSSAQYWKTVMPEAVLTANDKRGTLSMQYGVAALVSAIITARKVVDHERRIVELEKENQRLKTEVEQLRLN